MKFSSVSYFIVQGMKNVQVKIEALLSTVKTRSNDKCGGVEFKRTDNPHYPDLAINCIAHFQYIPLKIIFIIYQCLTSADSAIFLP